MPSCHARIGLCAFALALVACLSRASPTDQHADTQVAWAETPPGSALVRWLAAYNTGNSDSLRAFATREFAPSDLTKRSAEERAASDRWMHVNLGRMRVVHVDSLTDTTITATVWQDLIEGWGHVSVRVASSARHQLISRRISFFDPEPADSPKNAAIPDARSDRALTERLDAYARRLVDADVFSGVVLVSRRGKVVFEKAYGLAQRTPNISNDLERRFQLASVSKMFTAVAIAQLVEKGELSFQDTLAKVLPDYTRPERQRRRHYRSLPAAILPRWAFQTIFSYRGSGKAARSFGRYMTTYRSLRVNLLASPPAVATSTAARVTSSSARSSSALRDGPSEST